MCQPRLVASSTELSDGRGYSLESTARSYMVRQFCIQDVSRRRREGFDKTVRVLQNSHERHALRLLVHLVIPASLAMSTRLSMLQILRDSELSLDAQFLTAYSVGASNHMFHLDVRDHAV